MSNQKFFLSTSINEINHRLKTGQLTPSDIAEEVIKRISSDNSKYKAFNFYDAELLRKKANITNEYIKQGNSIRILEGIPVGIKDIINTSEYPTQMGSPIWKGFTPGNDARVIFNLLKNGASVAGKTVTAEFAVHTLNETINPYDPSRTPGTSSSGSAVAVATGMVPLAVGTQTAGSIIRPASFCGVFGFKPSFGLIPRTGILKTTDTLDSVGFFTAHAEDIILAFNSMRVHGFDYPISHIALSDKIRQEAPKERSWKVALIKTHTWKYASEYAKLSLVKLAEKINLSSNIEITEVELPVEMNSTHDVHAVIYNKLLAYYFQGEYEQKKLVSQRMCQLIEEGQNISPCEYLNALEVQNQMCLLMDNFFNNYDIILSLATAGEAPLREDEELPDPALMWTLTHLPVVCIPAFRSPSGLPFAVQFAAKKYNDLKLLNFIKFAVQENILPGSLIFNSL